MSKESVEYLRHILHECNYITTVITPNLSKDELLTNETLKRAVVRSLEIIGEASKKISIDVKLSWGKIPWRKMSGMRDGLIHDYMGVNYHIVWDVVKNSIPEIKSSVEEIINSEKN